MKTITLVSLLCINVLVMHSCNNKKNKEEISETILAQTKNEEKTMPREKLVRYVNRMDSIDKLSYSIMEDYEVEDLSFLKDPRYCGYTSKDIEDLLSLVAEDLEANGYKTPTEDAFLNKVKTVFQVSPNSKIPYTINHEQFFLVPCREKGLEYRGTQGDYEYREAKLIFSRTHRLVLRTNIWDGNYLRDDNTGQVTTVAPYVIHRNKYLFNDSKSSYTWLVLNDSTFLNDLFVDYGYTQDKKLDKWILDKRVEGLDRDTENLIKFVRTFVYLKPDKQLKFNKEIFEIITDNPTIDYMRSLLTYTEELGKFGELEIYPNLNFAQRAEIYARLIYLGEDVSAKHPNTFYDHSYMSNFRVNIGIVDGRYEDLYYEEFKRNNYYDLPKFKQYWDATNEEVSQRIEYIIENSDKG